MMKTLPIRCVATTIGCISGIASKESRVRVVRCLTVRSLHSSAASIVSVFEHVLTRRVKSPIIALSLATTFAGDFDETFVQTEVMADRILPAFLVLFVKGKSVYDELINLIQSQFFVRCVLNCHGYKGDVTVWGFDIRVLVVCCRLVLAIIPDNIFVIHSFIVVVVIIRVIRL